MARASVFLHELDTDCFATCTYAEVDLSTGAVRCLALVTRGSPACPGVG